MWNWNDLHDKASTRYSNEQNEIKHTYKTHKAFFDPITSSTRVEKCKVEHTEGEKHVVIPCLFILQNTVELCKVLLVPSGSLPSCIPLSLINIVIQVNET